VIGILFGLALTQSIVLMVTSFLPIYVDENYHDITSTMVGVILRYYRFLESLTSFVVHLNSLISFSLL
jgi:hypothetical protein